MVALEEKRLGMTTIDMTFLVAVKEYRYDYGGKWRCDIDYSGGMTIAEV